ncbi:MAG: hypothetical protein JWP89_4023 [Schlesneria sp.]|nr:hypothetical protein [Schlesneria sp.]
MDTSSRNWRRKVVIAIVAANLMFFAVFLRLSYLEKQVLAARTAAIEAEIRGLQEQLRLLERMAETKKAQ